MLAIVVVSINLSLYYCDILLVDTFVKVTLYIDRNIKYAFQNNIYAFFFKFNTI